LPTSGVPTADDIISAVLQTEGSDQDIDEHTAETVPTKLLVTYSQAQDAVQILLNFSENNKTVDDIIFNALSVTKRNTRVINVKSIKLPTQITFKISKVVITIRIYLFFKIISMRF
jgi:hypothetical protein